jgi:hypothetical protein
VASRLQAYYSLFSFPNLSLSLVLPPLVTRTEGSRGRTGGAIIIAHHTPKAPLEPSSYPHCHSSQEPTQKILESKKGSNKNRGGLKEEEEEVLAERKTSV